MQPRGGIERQRKGSFLYDLFTYDQSAPELFEREREIRIGRGSECRLNYAKSFFCRGAPSVLSPRLPFARPLSPRRIATRFFVFEVCVKSSCSLIRFGTEIDRFPKLCVQKNFVLQAESSELSFIDWAPGSDAYLDLYENR